MFELIKSFEDAIKNAPPLSGERQSLVMVLAYMVIMFGAFIQVSKGLKLDLYSLKRHFEKGKELQPQITGFVDEVTSHVVITLWGRFKGEVSYNGTGE